MLTKRENEQFWAALDPLTYEDMRELEDQSRTDGSYLVVCFGILSYRVLKALPTEEAAEGTLAWIQGYAERGNLQILPLTSNAHSGDFQVRTQNSLDDLTKAILGSYT